MTKIETLKKKISKRELTIGSWISIGNTQICEMLTQIGFDWIVIDMEHTSIEINHALELIQVISLSDCIPMIRVGKNDPLLIKRALDSGAQGVIVPMVNSVKEAKDAVKAAYYPPFGERGFGIARAHRYGNSFEDYVETAKNNTILIVQIEHINAVNNLSDIIAVDGVDGFMVGPYDLSGTLGAPGKWDTPEFFQAMEKINSIIKETTKTCGYHVVHTNHDDLKNKIKLGYNFIAYGSDMIFLQEKLKKESKFIGQLKNGL